MGCGGSRFDKRKDNAGDLFTVGLNFVGGEGNEDDGCPCDKVVFTYAEGQKEPTEVFKVKGLEAEDEEIVKKIAKATFDAVKAQVAFLEKEHGKPVDGKKVLISGKYELASALDQLNNVASAFKDAEVVTEEEVKEEAKEEEAKEGEMMMEGGDDMMMMAPEEDPYKDDAEDYKGFKNFPKLLLKQTTVNPYFGDLVKSDAIHFEFAAVEKGGLLSVKMPPLNPMALMKAGAAPGAFAGAAGLLSSAVNSAEGAEKDVFFAGFIGENDLESLKGIAEAKGPIMFPGVIGGWESEEKALKTLDGVEASGDQKLSKVLYKIKTSVVSAVVCRHFVSRLHATVDKLEEKDGVQVVDLTSKAEEKLTVEDWLKKKDAPAEAPAAAAEEPKMEEAPAMDESPAMDGM
uniref:Uncharacterized protein n=1 Tax=Strombidium rassoulzadegani TaxID=1082188 RepID=A0A7S3CU34_9SPIT|eukprot:CAMPEP_0168613176 /NCGR_PEP_ID=MMETSP0449_2-20121227/3314_1 /TAXON_ID=1082188 /ORGANISM="Strombidium rassoulzadegani, Strain ras09" /LENGTH=401 /DNA_ID=CAMNT_0008653797 /DNA_START=9 /DNA_END=1214 /DNA_ORIENTATION=-